MEGVACLQSEDPPPQTHKTDQLGFFVLTSPESLQSKNENTRACSLPVPPLWSTDLIIQGRTDPLCIPLICWVWVLPKSHGVEEVGKVDKVHFQENCCPSKKKHGRAQRGGSYFFFSLSLSLSLACHRNPSPFLGSSFQLRGPLL